jgi:cysteine synthase A
MACAYYGLQFVCVVDPKTSRTNIDLMRAYGAEVEMVTEPDPETGEFLPARIRRVRELLGSIENSFWVNQYSNEHNPLGHQQTMHEIAAALEGKVDYLFCATSTCGTLRGCHEYIRGRDLTTKVYGVDAVGSVIFGGAKGKRLLTGHGAAVRPPLFKEDMADGCVHVTDLECVVGCHRLARREAILAGASSGAVLMAAGRVRHDLREGANCVLILPDRGERYVSTIFSPSWVEEHFGRVSHLWEDAEETQICQPLTATS